MTTAGQETPIQEDTKGGRTRTRILEAAVGLFASRGYEGASIRDVEGAAGVNRGLVTYHFGSKADLWKAAFAHLFQPYLNDLEGKAALLRAVDAPARLRLLIEHFVRTSAERPAMNQIMIQENFAPSWRSAWIVEHYLRPAQALYQQAGGDDAALAALAEDPHRRYALLGACSLVFSLPCEVEAIYGAKVRDECFIARHAATVAAIFLGWQADPGNVETDHV